MRYLVDTSIISLALRRQHGTDAVLRRHATADLLLSAVVLGEGCAGAYRTSRPERWLGQWHLLTEGWEHVPFDAACADRYGRLRADLERRGRMIGDRDCQIAATALAYAESHGVTVAVITDNVREFKHVPGLRVENWAKR